MDRDEFPPEWKITVPQRLPRSGLTFRESAAIKAYIDDLETRLAESEKAREKAVAEMLDAINGPRCGDCLDTGMRENRTEGKYPCTCITETDYWQWNEARLAAIQGENVRYLDTIGKIRAAYHNICNTTNIKTRDLWNTLGEIVELADQTLSTTPETVKVQGRITIRNETGVTYDGPAAPVQAVIEAAIRMYNEHNVDEDGDQGTCKCFLCQPIRALNE